MCRIFVYFNAYKKKKDGVFEGCPVGWGGVPTGAGLVDGGGRPRALVAGGLGLGWLFQRGAGRVGLLGSSTGGGKSKGFGSGRVGVLFFESWRVDLVTCVVVCLVLFGGQGRVGLAGQGLGGGSKGFGSGGGRR